MDSKNVTMLKAICVDDDLHVLELVCDMVRELGFEAISARSADECLELVKIHHFHTAFIISDFKMPKKNGFELRGDLLKQFKQIPFIMLSGEISREMALQAVEYKISAFLSKPVREAEFRETVLKEAESRIASIREDEELLDGFVIDAEQLTEEMESLLLSLESDPMDLETINRIFACAHTIKGSSGFFDPDYVHRFTHKYEDFLSQFKSRPDALNAKAITVLLNGLDTIKALVRHLKARSTEAIEVKDLITIFDVDLKAEVEVEKQATKKIAGDGGEKPQKAEEVRVSMKILDEFMERSGELTVLRNMINKVVKVIEQEYPENKEVATLSELLEEMHKTNGLMQEKVSDLRKVPVSHIFRPLFRTIRDLNSQLGKQIVMSTKGEDLRVDHTLSEVLNKCLIHMIRNSADHGIESAQDRQAANKKPEGNILLSAQEINGEVIVKIADDGKGLNPNFIKRKAIEKGLITDQVADRMSDAEARMLIFEPGFSTAAQVTDVSGRGVGTDMVMKSIKAVGGKILVNSEVGKGTEFVITMPVPKSVQILSSLFVECNGDTFGLPQDDIRRIIRLEPEEAKQRLLDIEKQKVIEVEGKLLPVLKLSEILKIEAPVNGQANDVITIVNVETRGCQFCLEVDGITDIEDTVVRRLSRDLKHLNVFSGATFLGDGNVGLLLNVQGIAEHMNLSFKEELKHREDADTVKVNDLKSQHILVELSEYGRFAVPQVEIFRLEEFSAAKIEKSGGQLVTIYRDQVMPLNFMEDLLELPRESRELKGEIVYTLVCHRNGKLVGVIVDSILDLVTHQAVDSRGDEGELFSRAIINDQTVGVVSFESIDQNRRHAGPSSIDSPSESEAA